MSDSNTFLSLLAAGRVSPSDIDDHIDQWHDGASTQELHAFLGMTRDQYATWLNRPEALMEFCSPRQDRVVRGSQNRGHLVPGPYKRPYRASRRTLPSKPGLAKPFSKDARIMHQRHGCTVPG